MSVIVKNVVVGSPAFKAGIKPGDTLVSVNGNEIMDVLDYRFYQTQEKLTLTYINSAFKVVKKTVKKSEYAELGLEFQTYLMDSEHHCKNKCIFCFIDQLPKGLRESLYFKDDDSRLSFLFGNYITLTNISEHEIERIIKMHISPVNISVHTTNPELRVKMMKNKNAGKVLGIINRLNSAGIAMNCQLVLVPGYNNGAELERTLADLTALGNVRCIAAVPVGLTKFRDGLEPLEPFNEDTAAQVISTADKFGEMCIQKYGDRRVYASDEFYLIAKKPIPEADFYGDFLQLENGVGLWALLKEETLSAINTCEADVQNRCISIATGVSAGPLIQYLANAVTAKWPNVKINVYVIKNEFFGSQITVAGLVTGGDIINQLKGKQLGEELLIPSSMLRFENDLFLDNTSVLDVERELNVKLTPVNNGGFEFLSAVLNTEV